MQRWLSASVVLSSLVGVPAAVPAMAEDRMLDPAYQRRQAGAIADGLEQFFGAARE